MGDSDDFILSMWANDIDPLDPFSDKTTGSIHFGSVFNKRTFLQIRNWFIRFLIKVLIYAVIVGVAIISDIILQRPFTDVEIGLGLIGFVVFCFFM